jgi:hypothetical protein
VFTVALKWSRPHVEREPGEAAEREAWVRAAKRHHGRGLASVTRPYPDERQVFCHANAATCQNSRELPQIASNFRHAGLPVTRQTSLQNSHI